MTNPQDKPIFLVEGDFDSNTLHEKLHFALEEAAGNGYDPKELVVGFCVSDVLRLIEALENDEAADNAETVFLTDWTPSDEDTEFPQ